MLENQLQSEAVEKQKGREFFLQFCKMLGQDNNNYPVLHISRNYCLTCFME